MDRTSNPYYGSGIHLDMRGSRLRSKRGIKIKVKQKQESTDPMDILMKHVAPGALANSSDRYDPPKCHPNTRVAVLDSIDRWAHGLGAPKPILWLRGPLGAGKSAIAQTLAERWVEKFETVASFFLSRTAFQRNQKGCIIPTMAYQFMLSIPELRPLICQAIAQDKGLFNKDLRTQMMTLIIQPLSAIQPDPAATGAMKVVLIDGLDECCEDLPGQNHEAQQREILDAIAFAAQQPGIPLRFIIASRPEPQITASFQRKPLVDLTHKIILDDSHNPDADIRLYLDCKFEEMRTENSYIDSSWPTEDDIVKIIEKSSGHFVYASVVVRQLEQPRQDPRETLKGILDIQGLQNPGVSPFAELDALYLHVMEKVSTKSLPVVTSVFQYLCFDDPIAGGSCGLEQLYKLAPRSPALIEKYLFIPQGQIYIHLVDLHSVLDIPPHSASTTASIQFIHASFNEFLTERYRSGSFFIDRDDAEAHLERIYLKHCYIEALNGYLLSTSFETTLFSILIRRRSAWSSSSPSHKEFAERVAALMGTNEIEFSKHIGDLGLSALQKEGNHRNPHSYPDLPGYAVAYDYLQNCGLDLEKYGLKESRYYLAKVAIT